MKFDKRTNWKSLNSEELEREYNPSSVIGGDYLPYVDEYIKQSQFSNKNLNIVHDSSQPSIATRLAINSDKFCNAAEWKILTGLEDGLRKTYDWALQNINKP